LTTPTYPGKTVHLTKDRDRPAPAVSNCVPTEAVEAPKRYLLEDEYTDRSERLTLHGLGNIIRQEIMQTLYSYDLVKSMVNTVYGSRLIGFVISWPFSFARWADDTIDNCGNVTSVVHQGIWTTHGIETTILDPHSDQPVSVTPSDPGPLTPPVGRGEVVTTVVVEDWYGDAFLDDEPGRFTKVPAYNGLFSKGHPTKQECNNSYGDTWIETNYTDCDDYHRHIYVGYRYVGRDSRICVAHVRHYT